LSKNWRRPAGPQAACASEPLTISPGSAEAGAGSNPEISAIVVNWDRRDLLRSCLNSLCGQRTGRHSFEIIVVDNGSTDGSVEMLRREFAGRTGVSIRLLRNPENRGFCAANNQAIAIARGSFVALLNNDAEADPAWLAALRDAVDASPEYGMAACKILVHGDWRRIDKVGHQMYPDGLSRGRGCGEMDLGQYDDVEETLWPDGCAAIYRKRMLEEIGGFDEDFFAYGDDSELGLRARIAGWRCVYEPRAVAYHHRGATLGRTSVRRVALIERNRLLLAAKLFPWSLLCFNGPYYIARIAAGIRAAIFKKGEVSAFHGLGGKLRVAAGLFMGDGEALAMLPRMLRKRRDIRKIRKLSPRQVHELILDHRITLRVLMEQTADCGRIPAPRYGSALSHL
jgi:GT2 family glycosyltransferase